MNAVPDLGALAPILQKALDRGRQGYTLADVDAELATGDAILWVGRNACAVTQHLDNKVLHVWLAGGPLDELQEAEAGLVALAQHLGCTAITAEGRDGWARALKELGWRSILRKEVGNVD